MRSLKINPAGDRLPTPYRLVHHKVLGAPGHTQSEASVALQRTCLREAPVPGSVSVGTVVGRGLRNQSLWVNNSVQRYPAFAPAALPSGACSPARLLLHLSPLVQREVVSGGPPTLIFCLLSQLLHFLSLFLIWVDNSLKQIMQWKALWKLKSVLRNQN